MLSQILKGIISYLPGVDHSMKGTGGTISARYCYSVWLRHLVMARKNGLQSIPRVVAELGPGDSIGIGLAALISGCEKYYALDVVEHASSDYNAAILEELLELFRDKADIPGEDEFPRVKPYLDNYDFPRDILDEKLLDCSLRPERIDEIRKAIGNTESENSLIQYKVPWDGDAVIESETIDLVYSQAVLEHVDALENAYDCMYTWVKPGGMLSHQIDLKSHGTAENWDGHWAYPDLVWKIIRGRRPFLINREPCSTHRAFLSQAGFKVLYERSYELDSTLQKHRLPEKFMKMTAKDFRTAGVFVQARKPL